MLQDSREKVDVEHRGEANQMRCGGVFKRKRKRQGYEFLRDVENQNRRPVPRPQSVRVHLARLTRFGMRDRRRPNQIFSTRDESWSVHRALSMLDILQHVDWCFVICHTMQSRKVCVSNNYQIDTRVVWAKAYRIWNVGASSVRLSSASVHVLHN